MLGETIRTLRQAKRLTQKQVAAKIGVSAAAVTQWETGGGIDLPNLKKLAKVLGVAEQLLLDQDGGSAATPSGKSELPPNILQDNNTSGDDNPSVRTGTNRSRESVHMSGDRLVGDANLNDILTRLRRLESAVFKPEEPAEAKSDPTHRRKA